MFTFPLTSLPSDVYKVWGGGPDPANRSMVDPPPNLIDNPGGRGGRSFLEISQQNLKKGFRGFR